MQYDYVKAALRRLAYSKLARFIVITAVVTGICIALLTHGITKPNFRSATEAALHVTKAFSGSKPHPPPKEGRLHFLVPATSSNPDLCKLLLSTQILDYPTPVLINFGHPEQTDEYVQHLAKVRGILDYLDNIFLLDPDKGEDLALIVDGYDVWFQLRRDVLLKRYYALNQAADERVQSRYGEEAFKEHGMRQTIVFGPDKLCWPIDFGRPACWAAPETTVDKYAYGPWTRQGEEANFDKAQPRWLNSGTVIGPVKDLKEFFRATLQEIEERYQGLSSDQLYMAEVWGRQEYARLLNKPDLMAYYRGLRYWTEKDTPEDDIVRRQPNITGMKTEYHVGIDYESSLFQTLAFEKQHLTWMRPTDSWPRLSPPGAAPTLYSAANVSKGAGIYQMQLPEDIIESAAPFSVLSLLGAARRYSSWHDVTLLYNVITQRTPVLLHFTGPKEFRHIWWQRLWFQARAKELRIASLHATAKGRGQSSEVIGGYRWRNAEPLHAEDYVDRGLNGAWGDVSGGWYSWTGLCGIWEQGMYEVRGEEFFHPAPKPPGEEGEDHPSDGKVVTVVVDANGEYLRTEAQQ